MDSTRNFSGLAAEYTAGRPVYAEAFLNDVVLAHDARADLRVRVLAPLGRQHGDAHEIFVPGNVIGALHLVLSPFFSVIL